MKQSIELIKTFVQSASISVLVFCISPPPPAIGATAHGLATSQTSASISYPKAI